MNKLTIVTVTYNAANVVRCTLESVRKLQFKNYEYIVIDGSSSDNTNDIVRQYYDVVTTHVVEPDAGIYDAMNKAIKHSSGEWLLFMNAGDEFASPDVLNGIDFDISGVDVYYSDTLIDMGKGMVVIEKANPEAHRFNHQSFIYRRRLHEQHGYYLTSKSISISDYLFCTPLWTRKNSIKLSKPISIFRWGGVSAGDGHFYQKIAVDLLLGYSTPMTVAGKILIYPLYKFLSSARASLRNISHRKWCL